MVKFIILLGSFIILCILFFIQDTLNKPVYNKMSNVYEEDHYGKTMSRFIVLIMCIISFFVGAAIL